MEEAKTEDPNVTFDKLPTVKELKDYYDTELNPSNKIKDLLADTERNENMRVNCEEGNFIFDFTHTKLDEKSFELLGQVSLECNMM